MNWHLPQAWHSRILFLSSIQNSYLQPLRSLNIGVFPCLVYSRSLWRASLWRAKEVCFPSIWDIISSSSGQIAFSLSKITLWNCCAISEEFSELNTSSHGSCYIHWARKVHHSRSFWNNPINWRVIQKLPLRWTIVARCEHFFGSFCPCDLTTKRTETQTLRGDPSGIGSIEVPVFD